MKKSYTIVSIFTVVVLCFILIAADDKPSDAKKKSASAAMPKPRPAPEMKDLTSLIGAWAVEEKHEPSPWNPAGGEGAGTATFRNGPGGFSVILDYKGSSGPVPNFTGHAIMTWDPAEKVYKTFWVDMMTPGAITESGKKEGNDIVYTGEMKMMGKEYRFKDTISDRTPTSFTLTSEVGESGSPMKKAMTLKYTKK